MKLVLAATGASGAIYFQRLLFYLAKNDHEIHLIFSKYAKQVVREEIGKLNLPDHVVVHSELSMNAPFASGSTLFDAMVIIPCSMGTVARIAVGIGDTLILRAADVFLKEKRKLILVPRETPWNLIHIKNILQLIEAGATIMPASPSFYSCPKNIEELADTLVFRILDQLHLPFDNTPRWKECS